MYKNNVFLKTAKPLTGNDISKVESIICEKLPTEIIQHYLLYNGGSPQKKYFSSDSGDTRVHEFLPMLYSNSLTFEGTYVDFKIENPILPVNLIPIAIDEGGDFFCFNRGTKDFGSIYFFWTEFCDKPDEASEYIAPSLRDFIESMV